MGKNDVACSAFFQDSNQRNNQGKERVAGGLCGRCGRM
jgi:hypothetical protein